MSERSLTSSKSQGYVETSLRRHMTANSYGEQCPALPVVSKGQIKPQVVTSDLLVWLLSERQIIASAGKAVEKGCPLIGV